VSVDSAGYANCVGFTSWIWSCAKPAMQAVSEDLPPARVRHMPTERSATVSAGTSIDVAPASRGPHVITGIVGAGVDAVGAGVGEVPSESVSVESAGYANCVGLTSWIWSCPKPAMQTVSELLPPARVKHMPTDRSATVSAGMSIDMAPAPRGPHVMDQVTPSKSVSVEPAMYADCVGLASWMWSCPKPAMQTVSEDLPPARVKHMPTERSATVSSGITIDVAPASRGPHVMTGIVGAGVDAVGAGVGDGSEKALVVVDSPIGPKPKVGIGVADGSE
jgi:hypothetical protein